MNNISPDKRRRKNTKKKSTRSNPNKLERFSARIESKWLEEAEYYPGGFSQYIREALYHYKSNRHIFVFGDILEIIAGEILILSKWKEKGHPGGAKWTEKEEQQLEYYERCFSILENSPFNDEL